MLRRVLPEKRDRMILLPVIGSQLIVTTSLFLMPLLIETLKLDGGLSGKAAGLLLSMELAVSAFATLCLSARVRNHSARHWALYCRYIRSCVERCGFGALWRGQVARRGRAADVRFSDTIVSFYPPFTDKKDRLLQWLLSG